MLEKVYSWEAMLTDYNDSYETALPIPDDALIELFENQRITVRQLDSFMRRNVLTNGVLNYLMDNPDFNHWLALYDDLSAENADYLLRKNVSTVATLLKKNFFTDDQLHTYLMDGSIRKVSRQMIFNVLWDKGYFADYPEEWLIAMGFQPTRKILVS